MATVSLSDQIACIGRELGLRRAVYPRLIDQQRMSAFEAELEIARMEAAYATLKALRDGEQGGLAL